MMERTGALAAACWVGLALAGDASLASFLGPFAQILWLVPILGSALLWRIFCRD
jgi:hypothetical protein